MCERHPTYDYGDGKMLIIIKRLSLVHLLGNIRLHLKPRLARISRIRTVELFSGEELHERLSSRASTVDIIALFVDSMSVEEMLLDGRTYCRHSAIHRDPPFS